LLILKRDKQYGAETSIHTVMQAHDLTSTGDNVVRQA
jgi:hypothetical protein